MKVNVNYGLWWFMKFLGKDKKLFIYGYSQAYGQADHRIAKAMLELKFKDYKEENITWSNEGY